MAQSEFHRNVFNGKTLSGKPIILEATDPQNWLRSAVSELNYALLFSQETDYDADYIATIGDIARTLRANINNPIHYDTNKPGLFLAKGTALLPNPRFTCADLINFGISGPRHVIGFLEDCGLSINISLPDIFIAGAFVLIDECIDALESGEESFAANLLYRAKELQMDVWLMRFGRSSPEKQKETIRKAFSERGRLAAEAMLAKSPKQAAKAKAKELWLEWQNGRAIHKSGAAFARHVVRTLPDIESEKSVERWVTEWREEAKK